ncbi:MAG: ATP-binding protein [Myxococcota bacterium]
MEDDGNEESAASLRARVSELEAELVDARLDQLVLRALCEALPQRVFWKDRSSTYLGGNTHVARDCGYDSYRDFPGKRDHDHFPKEQADFFIQCDKEVMDQGEPLLAIEEPQKRPDGSTSWLLTNKVPLRDDRGEVVGLLGTYIDVTEEKRTNERLKEALVQAKVSEAKSDFLTAVSHELRTPLTLVLGPLTSLLAEPLPANVRDPLQVIRRNALRLRQLVDDVLDLRKADEGMMRPHWEDLDVAAHIRTLLDDMAPAAHHRRIALKVEADQPIHTRTDVSMIERVVLNLVGNAFKFTPPEGCVTVIVRRHGSDVLLEVNDTGPGIPSGQLDRLFARYEQGPAEAGGTGLGLALVRQLVTTLGGTVEASSIEGEGATFTVTIPIRGDDRPPIASPKRPNRPSMAELLKPAPQAVSPKNSVHEGIRILIIEDNVDMQNHVRAVLAPLGPTRLCSDGAQALDAMDEFSPDVIVSDVMMPVLDGLELTRRLKADPERAHIPILLLTARAGSDATSEGLNQGADDYVRKPFEPHELQARVRAAARLHRNYQSLAEAHAEIARTQERLQQATEELLAVEPLAVAGYRLRASSEVLKRVLESRTPNDDDEKALQGLLAEAESLEGPLD